MPKTREYTITCGRAGALHEEPAIGIPVGKYLAVRKDAYEWVVDHIPTGFKLGKFRFKKLAIAVAKDVDSRVGDDLRSEDTSAVAEAIGGKQAKLWILHLIKTQRFVRFNSAED